MKNLTILLATCLIQVFFFQFASAEDSEIVIAVIGESHAVKMFDAENQTLPADNNINTLIFCDRQKDPFCTPCNEGDPSWSTCFVPGDGAISLADGVNAAQADGKVILVNAAVSETALLKENSYCQDDACVPDCCNPYWLDLDGSIYSDFISRVSSMGKEIDYILWIQGARDALSYNPSWQDYFGGLVTLWSRIKHNPLMSNAKFIIYVTGNRDDVEGNIDNGMNAVRYAQYKFADAENNPDVYIAGEGTTFELNEFNPIGDKDLSHYTWFSYVLMGERFSQTINDIEGFEEYHRGPYIDPENPWEVIDSSKIHINIIHRGGNDFTPSTDISGFRVDGIPVSASRLDENTIELIGVGFSSSSHIRYLSGNNPYIENFVKDNSDMRLPMEFYIGDPFYSESTHDSFLYFP